MRTLRQGRTDRRITGKGGRGGRQSQRKGRRASSEEKERAASRTAKMSATTCRAERCRTEIQADVRRLFKFSTAHKITTGPRASACSCGVVVNFYLKVVAVSLILAGYSVLMVFHEEGLPVVAINIVVHSFCFLLCNVCSVFPIPYIGLVILCSTPDDV